MRLQGKVAIITGGNSGIGEAAALLFVREGAKVVITARRKEQLDAVADKVRAAGGEVLAVVSDISDPDQCEAVVAETVKVFGTVDILVNNAGVLDHGIAPVEKVSNEDIDFVLDVNAKGTIYFSRAAVKVMAEKKSGAIINVASVAGVLGCGGAAYCASKGAVVALTKHTALRMASEGVRCNAICPGSVKTPMSTSPNLAGIDRNMIGAMQKHSDMSLPVCEPEDVANIALFLASDESRALTGQVMISDFGVTL